MNTPNTETIVTPQTELGDLARTARQQAGLTQAEAAERLDVARPNISKAENDPSGRYLNLQRRILSELAGWNVTGPLWKIERPAP